MVAMGQAEERRCKKKSRGLVMQVLRRRWIGYMDILSEL